MLRDRFNRPLHMDDLVLMSTCSVYANRLEYGVVNNIKGNSVFIRMPDYASNLFNNTLREMTCYEVVFKIENPNMKELELKESLVADAELRRLQILRYESEKRRLRIGSIIVPRKSSMAYVYLGKIKSAEIFSLTTKKLIEQNSYHILNFDKNSKYLYLELRARNISDIRPYLNDKNYINNILQGCIEGYYSLNAINQPKSDCYLLDEVMDLKHLMNEKQMIIPCTYKEGRYSGTSFAGILVLKY